MAILKTVLTAFAISLSINSHALIITDVISVDKQLALQGYIFEFDIAKHGYNPVTDRINFVELDYDFSKMIDPIDDFDDFDTLETIQLNSYLFDGRSNFHDINPGVIHQRLSWRKDISFCQKENYDTGECELNLDLNGNAREFLSVYNGDIWLSEVRFSVDVTRTEMSEPSELILLVMGLGMIFIGRAVERANKEES